MYFCCMVINLSTTEENYLKAIFSLSKKAEGSVSTNNIADKLSTKASSVTDMIKKLADKMLVDYKKYQGVSLTQKGRKTAVSIVRNHRLWEVFLVDKLNFKWDEVHDLAEQLEHIKSEQLTERLDAFLKFPTHDPHGDPIPDKNGNIEQRMSEPLSIMKEDDSCIIVGVIDSSSLFLKFLNKNNIKLGSVLNILQKEAFDDSMLVNIDGSQHTISQQIIKNILVKKQ